MLLSVLAIALLSANAYAADSAASDLHKIKAQKLVETKDWADAEPEAKAYVELAPTDPEGWLLYGVIEQRLEHNSEAARAYHQYLNLNPPADKAEAVKQRLATVEVREEKQEMQDLTERTEKYGSKSLGLYLSYAPVRSNGTVSDLAGSTSGALGLGFQFPHGMFGVSYQSSSVPKFEAPGEGQTAANAVYTNVGPATYQTYDLYLDVNIGITDAFEATGPFALFIPLQVGFYMNSLNLDSGSRKFSNYGMDLAFGGGVQWYTRYPVAIGLEGLWHSGFSITDIGEDASSQGVRGPTGAAIKGGNSGFELRLTVTWLLGYEKSVAEKAGAD